MTIGLVQGILKESENGRIQCMKESGTGALKYTFKLGGGVSNIRGTINFNKRCKDWIFTVNHLKSPVSIIICGSVTKFELMNEMMQKIACDDEAKKGNWAPKIESSSSEKITLSIPTFRFATLLLEMYNLKGELLDSLYAPV